MSTKPLSINKPSSTKPKRYSYNLQADLAGHSNVNLKHRPVSSLKIEDKLISQKIVYNKRLETLKKTLEEEMLKDVKSKPDISKKSRALAEKAEKRMMQQYATVKSSPSKNIEEFSQVQPDVSIRNSSDAKIPKRAVSATPTGLRTAKKKTKSLLALNVLERSQAWLMEKQKKIDLRKKNKEDMELVECTFSPKTMNKMKVDKSIRDESSNISFVSSPNSIVDELCEQNSKIAKNKQKVYKKIAPYQVNISFRCGIDLNSFLKRAK